MGCTPGSVCRPALQPCDVEERCTAQGTCPADAFAMAGVECRAARGPCDVAEKCTGGSDTCPADERAPSSLECRSSKGPCDVAEKCSGTADPCPADAFAPSTTTCGATPSCSAGVAQPASFCSGAAAACTQASTQSCNGYQCSAGPACRTSCADASQCLGSHYCCLGGFSCTGLNTCQAKKADGAACGNAAECTSGTCVVRYADADGDGYGGVSLGARCGPIVAGQTATAGDCCDSDGNARPGQTQFFGSARAGCGGYDYDCANGEQSNDNSPEGITCEVADPTCNAQTGTCVAGNGWLSFRPGCGGTGDFRSCSNRSIACVDDQGQNGTRSACNNVVASQRQVLCR